MVTIDLQGTKFSFSVLPIKNKKHAQRVKIEIAIENEFVRYQGVDDNLTREEWEELLFSMRRLLAGAYATEYSLQFLDSGFAVDFYPHTDNGMEVPRERRRQEDCVMIIRFLMQDKKGAKKLGGVYSLTMHRAELDAFSNELLKEYREIYDPFEETDGEFLFVGVSPLGYTGCNYWYLDPTKSVARGEYVWVRMGRHNTEQVVYVDHARYYEGENVPYDPKRIKCVLRKAKPIELENGER